MTNTPETVPGVAALLRRIEGARSVSTPVDSQGHPTGQPARFDYDERGILTTATPGREDTQLEAFERETGRRASRA